MRKSRGLLGKSACLGGVLLAAAGAVCAQVAERKLVKKVAPEYPAILREKRIHGTVKLNVIVKPDGAVRDIVVIGGNPALVDASVRAVKQWKYAPSDRESTIEVTIQFDPNAS
jgi:TonB family protein